VISIEDPTHQIGVIDAQRHVIAQAAVLLKDLKTTKIQTFVCSVDWSYRIPQLPTDRDYDVWTWIRGMRSDALTISTDDSRHVVKAA
jgi:hypothetical protein